MIYEEAVGLPNPSAGVFDRSGYAPKIRELLNHRAGCGWGQSRVVRMAAICKKHPVTRAVVAANWAGGTGGKELLAWSCCRIMKITEILMAEHVVFHNLFDHLERTAPRLKTLAELKALAAALETLLRAHSNTEDELFFAPLEHCLEQLGQSETFHEEHEEIDQSLLDVQKAKQIGVARKQLAQALVACREHFDKEERIVFPLAERKLKGVTLQALGGVWMKRREAALK